uniref:Sulfotransferase n=1 Tax=Aegilops tauschii subsp. strangulata TaxID=200361 RepID=A0A453TER2_AEGTS
RMSMPLTSLPSPSPSFHSRRLPSEAVRRVLAAGEVPPGRSGRPLRLRAEASFPKCGTTWLKALAFATRNRAEHPPRGLDHPLLRRNPHDIVQYLELQFAQSMGHVVAVLLLSTLPRAFSRHTCHTPSYHDASRRRTRAAGSSTSAGTPRTHLSPRGSSPRKPWWRSLRGHKPARSRRRTRLWRRSSSSVMAYVSAARSGSTC